MNRATLIRSLLRFRLLSQHSVERRRQEENPHKHKQPEPHSIAGEGRTREGRNPTQRETQGEERHTQENPRRELLCLDNRR